MAKISLGINNSFAVNRYPEPEEWTRIVRDFGLKHVQFFADLIEPSIFGPDATEKLVEKTNRACRDNGIKIHDVFGGTMVRWYNFLLHPEEEVRRDALRWFEKYIGLAADLRSTGCGCFLGSFSFRDLNNPERYNSLLDEAIERWHVLAKLAKDKGLSCLMFEPMSIPREVPCTIDQAKELYERLNDGSELPVKLCLDVGHGAYRSGSEDDRNPYAWVRELSPMAPVIHIQQTDGKSSKHWPFTPQFNKIGIIEAGKVIEAIEDSGAEEVLLVLEVFSSFFEPGDTQVIEDLRMSVDYWRGYVED